MKVSLPEKFLSWFKRTNQHLFVNAPSEAEVINSKLFKEEVSEYVNDVLMEHMETLEAELDPIEPNEENPNGDFFGDEI